MSLNEYLFELTYPARNATTLLAIIGFAFLLGLAGLAGILGLWLLIMVVPAMCRYLVLLGQARARGAEAEPPGIEYFSLVGNFWTLFPALPFAAVGYGFWQIRVGYGQPEAMLFGFAAAAIFPAMMGVLMITQSPTQALNPVAIYRFVRETGESYWWGPLTLVAIVFIGALGLVPGILGGLYLVFAFYAVAGAVMRAPELIDDVDFDDPVEKSVEEQLAVTLRERTGVLNHAYGLASRSNRQGGLDHILAWLVEDPDPIDAWPWFFEHMLKWEQPEPALFFAQYYLHWLLERSDDVAAVKLILRCRLINDAFRPKPADRHAAVNAAERTGNTELADTLRRL